MNDDEPRINHMIQDDNRPPLTVGMLTRFIAASYWTSAYAGAQPQWDRVSVEDRTTQGEALLIANDIAFSLVRAGLVQCVDVHAITRDVPPPKPGSVVRVDSLDVAAEQSAQAFEDKRMDEAFRRARLVALSLELRNLRNECNRLSIMHDAVQVLLRDAIAAIPANDAVTVPPKPSRRGRK